VSWWRRRAQEPHFAGSGGRADRFLTVHGKVLDHRVDSAEATMEDGGKRSVVDDGVVGRPMARVHQTGILTEERVPGGGVIPALDDPMARVERQQPLSVGILGANKVMPYATSMDSSSVLT